MSLKHITMDYCGRLHEVTDMFDRHSRKTEDPSLATACVIKLGDRYVESDTDEIPIYTVH